jgi:hypothetical protein
MAGDPRKLHDASGSIVLVPQHVLQNAAMPDISELIERVDAADERKRLDTTIEAMNPAANRAT